MAIVQGTAIVAYGLGMGIHAGRLISSEHAVTESRLHQPGRQGVVSQFGAGARICLQCPKGPAMINPPPGIPRFSVDHVPDFVVGEGVRTLDIGGF